MTDSTATTLIISVPISSVGLLSFYLRVEVRQTNSGITICQSAYALKILEKGGMVDSNLCHVPMKTRLKLSKESSGSPADATPYRSIIRSLRYLVHTHPDIAFAVGYVSIVRSSMEKPTSEHMAAVKHILPYIAGTRFFGCHYARMMEEPRIVGYCDNDWAVLFFFGSSAITLQS